MIKPYDLGNNLVEHTQRIKVDDLLRKVKLGLKTKLLESEIEALGLPVSLTTSKTRFGGFRFWFKCPECGYRKGVLFMKDNFLACVDCHGLKYKNQRYKGMSELKEQDSNNRVIK